jgi:hypothetical protein
MVLRENPTQGTAPSPALSSAARSFMSSFEILSDAGNTFTGKEYDPETPPFLSLDDQVFVGGELLKRGFSKDDAGRWFLGNMKRAISYLTPAERDELLLLNDQANSILSLEEATEFERLKRKYEQGSQLTKDDERMTSNIIRKALESLPPTKLSRYQFLMGKGVRAALAAK